MSSRETIQPKKGNMRYIHRDQQEQFTDNHVSVGKSLAAGERSKAKMIVTNGQGDCGDRRKS